MKHYVYFGKNPPDPGYVEHAFEVTPQMWDQMVGSCLAMADNAAHLPEEWKVIKL